jgi:hypothetical protein
MHNPKDVKTFALLTDEDLERDHRLDEREVLHILEHEINNELGEGTHASPTTWLQASAVGRLLSRVETKLGNPSSARMYLTQANDCEIHATRIMTHNNRQAVQHLQKYLSSHGGFTSLG